MSKSEKEDRKSSKLYQGEAGGGKADLAKAETELKEADAKVEKAKAELKEADAKVKEAKAELKEADAKVKEADAKVEKAKAELKEAKAGRNAQEATLALQGLSLALQGLSSAQQAATSAQTRYDALAHLPVKNIFTHGFPPLGAKTAGCSSTPRASAPDGKIHASAIAKEKPFATTPPVLQAFPSNIWTHIKKNGTLGGYSTEADVNRFVDLALEDVLGAAGLSDTVKLTREVEVLSTRPDWRVIYLPSGVPVGIVEGKQPAHDAMTHVNILGEVYDQLMHLRSIFRVSTPLAILCSYNQLRVCWLDDRQSNEVASMTELPAWKAFQTSLKYRPNETPSPPSSAVQPTPKPREEAGLAKEPDLPCLSQRNLCVSPIFECVGKAELPLFLVSLFQKMILTKFEPRIYSPEKPISAVLRLATSAGFSWNLARCPTGLHFDSFVSPTTTRFFFWEELGHGADGKVYLVSGGAKGSVGVLKFFFDKLFSPEKKAMPELEKAMWDCVYPWAKVRVVTVMDNAALLMPWFAKPSMDERTLQAVATTLKNDYHQNGFIHGDVAWRNVGVCKTRDTLEAIVFDLGRVFQLEKGQTDDWITDAVQALRKKMPQPLHSPRASFGANDAVVDREHDVTSTLFPVSGRGKGRKQKHFESKQGAGFGAVADVVGEGNTNVARTLFDHGKRRKHKHFESKQTGGVDSKSDTSSGHNKRKRKHKGVQRSRNCRNP